MKITKLAEIAATIAQNAWRLSRDPKVTTPLEEVLAVDAPVNEMPTYILQLEDFTILEREIFATPRNHVMWARTSRVDDPLLFTVPTEFAKHVAVGAIRERMRTQKAKGMPQDHWRANLPLLAHTSWCSRLSLRDLVKMAAYFAFLSKKTKPPFSERYTQASNALMAQAPAEMKLTSYKLDHFLHEQYMNKESGRSKFGSAWSVVYAQVPLMLRAQLVRHRPLHFIDDLYHLLRSEDGVFKMNMETKLHMELCAPEEIWRELIGKRACWIASADLWQDITVYFSSGILPCAGGHCPYNVDNTLRMQGKDPNPPCPIYLDLTKQDKLLYFKAMREHAMATKPKWWLEKITS